MSFVYLVPSRLLFYKDRSLQTLTISPTLVNFDSSEGAFLATTFAKQGSPAILSSGVMSGTSSTNYAKVAYPVSISGSQDFQLNFKFTAIQGYWVNSWLLADSVTSNLFGCYLGEGTVSCYMGGEEVVSSTTTYTQGHSYEGYFKRASNVYSLYLKDTSTSSEITGSATRTDSLTYSGTILVGRTGE